MMSREISIKPKSGTVSYIDIEDDTRITIAFQDGRRFIIEIAGCSHQDAWLEYRWEPADIEQALKFRG